MAYKNIIKNNAYGLGQPTITMAPLPIVSQRAPTAGDQAEIGTIWIDQPKDDSYILTTVTGGTATWINAGGGTGTFNALTVTTTADIGTALTVGTTLEVTGNTTLNTGIGIVQSSAAGLLTSSAGTNGQLLIGAGAAAAPVWAAITPGAGINVTNGAGTITIAATGATAVQYTCDDANVVVPDGVGNVNVVGGVNCGSVGAVANTITINVDNAPTFTGLVTCQLGIDVSGADVTLASATNAGDDIYLHAAGGVAETIHLEASQGTGVNSIELESALGGITLSSGLVSDDAINIESLGGFDVDCAMQLNLASSENATDAIVITAPNGGIDITSGGAAGEDIDITTTSSINLVSSENAAQAIYLHTNGGIAETIDIHADQGTNAASIYLHSDVGGLTIDTGLNTADSVNIDANSAGAGGFDLDAGTNGIICDTTGAVSLDAALASNFTVTTAANDLTLESVLGTVIVNAGEDTADAIYLHADGGVTETIHLHADQGTAANSIDLESDDGGITLTATAFASDDAININAAAGGVDIDGAMHIDIQTTEDQNDAMQLIVTQGGIDITAQGADAGDNIDITSARAVIVGATGDIAQNIYLHANGGTNETVQIHADQGTAVTSIYCLSDDGGITLEATALASDDAINITATAGGIDIDGAMHIDISTTEDQNDAMLITATAGGIDITAAGTDAGDDIDITSAREINLLSNLNGAECIYLHADGGVNESIDLHADQGTGVDSIQLSSDVGGITMTATGLASDDAINLEAVAGGIDMNAGMTIDVQTTYDANAAMILTATQGGIDIIAQGADAGDDIDINSTQDIHFTSTVDMTYTVGGIYDINGTGNITIDSTAGTIGIGADADAFAINIGTGAAARTITLGNATGATAVAIDSGTGDITLTSTDDITLAAASGDISIDGQTCDLNATGGALSATPGTQTAAGTAVTLNARLGVATLTGNTTASGADIDIDITNSFITQGVGVMVTVSNLGTNDADIQVEGTNTQTAGHLNLHCINQGPAALNGNIVVTFWVIN